MNLLIVGKNPLSRLIQSRAEARGHFADIVSSKALIIRANPQGFKYKIRGKELLLSDYDIVFLYTVGRRIWHWIMFARHLRRKYPFIKVVYNKYADPKYSLIQSSLSDMYKFKANGLPFPKTVVIHSVKAFKIGAKRFSYPFILKVRKPGFYQKGKGVFLIRSLNDGIKITQEHKDAHYFVLREFIPNDGDYRFFVVGYKVVAAMKRVPKPGEYRSNISQGGKGIGVDLKSVPELVTLAEKAARVTRTEIAGVDIIVDKDTGKPYILEVNHGPQFRGVTKASGVDVALKIVEYFEELVSGSVI